MKKKISKYRTFKKTVFLGGIKVTIIKRLKELNQMQFINSDWSRFAKTGYVRLFDTLI